MHKNYIGMEGVKMTIQNDYKALQGLGKDSLLKDIIHTTITSDFHCKKCGVVLMKDEGEICTNCLVMEDINLYGYRGLI